MMELTVGGELLRSGRRAVLARESAPIYWQGSSQKRATPARPALGHAVRSVATRDPVPYSPHCLTQEPSVPQADPMQLRVGQTQDNNFGSRIPATCITFPKRCGTRSLFVPHSCFAA